MINQNRRFLWLAAALLLLMAVTRGSHVGSSFSLPDATLAVMLLGGLWLRRGAWFAGMMAAAVAVDAYAVGIAGISDYCLSPAYWALVPTYGAMWLGGRWLAKRSDAFAPMAYLSVALATTSVAFVLSTYSFYLFSGRFPEAPLFTVLQHGWEYYPAYLGFTLMYLGVAWLLQQLAKSAGLVRVRSA